MEILTLEQKVEGVLNAAMIAVCFTTILIYGAKRLADYLDERDTKSSYTENLTQYKAPNGVPGKFN